MAGYGVLQNYRAVVDYALERGAKIHKNQLPMSSITTNMATLVRSISGDYNMGALCMLYYTYDDLRTLQDNW